MMSPVSFETPAEMNGAAHDERPVESRVAWTLAQVVAQWEVEGALIHEPTGIVKLDELTGGGPVYGSRWYWLGAPDAGKTAELVQIADVWARRGIVVGFLAVDEEPTDITTRFAQRAKYTRQECETRAPETLREISAALRDLPVRLYGHEWTIEEAADDLVAYARTLGMGNAPPRRVALFVDSIQQVSSAAVAMVERELSPREIVSANVRALRGVATGHRLIAMATSEMNRNAYRSVESVEQFNDIASGKESGAIEFSARVMVSLRSVKGEKDLSVLRVVKNKHGASGDEIHRRIDRRRMVIEDTEAPEQKDAEDERDTRGKKQVTADAAKLVALLLDFRCGIGVNRAREQLKARHGSFSKDRVGPAVAKLGAAVVQRREGPGKEMPMYLDGRAVPDEILALLTPEQRATATASRPPETVSE